MQEFQVASNLWGRTLPAEHRCLPVLTKEFLPVLLQLMEVVCKGGVRAVESQQAAAAALSAAVAAAGHFIMRAGIF